MIKKHFMILCSITVCIFITQKSSAQETLTFTMEQVIDMAKGNSPAAKIAKTTYENHYWQYRYYKSNYLPQLRLDGTLPSYYKANTQVQLDDGSLAFRNQSTSTSSLDLSIEQNIGLTGGRVYLKSYLQRLDDFSQSPKYISYLAEPLSIGLQQPLFQYNDLKWQNRIEPLLYEESKRQLNEDMENVSLMASERFFNLLLSEIEIKIEEENLTNNDTLYQISKGRYNIGKIAENELLQMELSVMNAKTNLAQAQLDRDYNTLNLRNYLNLKGNQVITLIAPELIPDFKVDENTALEQARKNRQKVIEFERRRSEADREVAQAKGNSGLNVMLNAQYGLSQTATDVSNAYQNPLNQQIANLTLSIPLVDWGRARSLLRRAQANRSVSYTNIEQEAQSFDQEVILLARQFSMQREKLIIAARADTIATKRYDITMKRYLIGKIDITELNIALQEKDSSRKNYVASLKQFWNAYFELRRKTLYDFAQGAVIKY